MPLFEMIFVEILEETACRPAVVVSFRYKFSWQLEQTAKTTYTLMNGSLHGLKINGTHDFMQSEHIFFGFCALGNKHITSESKYIEVQIF
jgi:hypothetical protein